MTRFTDSSSSNPPPQQPDRRREPRVYFGPVRSSILIANIEGEVFPARVRNISTGGICLVSSSPHESGATLAVELRNLNRNVGRNVQVQVIYQLEHPNGDWLVGGAFTRKLTGEELQALL